MNASDFIITSNYQEIAGSKSKAGQYEAHISGPPSLNGESESNLLRMTSFKSLSIKYALDDIGSGSHVHLSHWRERVNVFLGSNGNCVHGMSKIGQEFMAGVLYHLLTIMAFTLICHFEFQYVTSGI